MNGGKLPPHDTNAEEAVNGSLLIDGELIYRITDLIQPNDFYHEPNKLIFEACQSLYLRNNTINQITVAQELNRQQRLETCGGAAYLSHLIAACPTSLDLEDYAQIVRRLAIMRRLINAAEQITAIGYQADVDVDASLNKAEGLLFQLRHGQGPQDLVHISQVLDNYFENIATAEADASSTSLPCIYTGFNKLDAFLGGFQRSDLIVLAGRPSMGKTSLALSIARNAVVDSGACVALFSLEMSRDPLVLRILSSEANVDFRRLRFGLHTEAEEKRIMEATGILSEAQLYLDDSPLLRVIELRGKVRRLYYERGIDMIIVDYLQLLQGDGRTENRVQEISYISRSLKALAREFNVPVIAVSQLSRAVEWRASHRPQLSDLRESGSIEQDADLVLFIYRDEYYFPTQEDWIKEHPDKEYPRGIATIIIAKHRNGPTGELALHFEAKTAKFEDIATTDVEPSLL